MESITRFVLEPDNKVLQVTFSHNKTHCYSLEYLRVCAPSIDINKNLVSHKKQIKLVVIEPVGKHGYRFVFDDDFSDIYSVEYLQLLHQEHDARWEGYLVKIAQSKHSREASINFVSV